MGQRLAKCVGAAGCFAAVCVAQFNPFSMPFGTIGKGYVVTVTTSGSCACTWTISAGSVPPGLNSTQVTVPSGTGLQISGVPTAAGTFSFTVRSQPNPPSTAPVLTKDYTIGIPQITTDSPLPNAYTTQTYSQSFTASDAPGPFQFSLLTGNLPPGLAFSGSTLSGIFPVSSENWNGPG